jgi:hypothetical protein
MKRFPRHSLLIAMLVTASVAMSAMGQLLPPEEPPGAKTACAKVHIQIKQEITFARQAFEARLGISNTFPDDLTNIAVTLTFADENGDPVPATTSTEEDPAVSHFFFKPDKAEGQTDAAPHPTTVAANSEQTLTWTIIPTLLSANGGGITASGRLYQIGANLSYTAGGKNEVVPINPDFIRVKPLPEIQLHYFLPYNVAGDDPTTPAFEPPVPFSLGLRLRNVGLGNAESLAIASSPPVIVNNDLQIPAEFHMLATRVNDQVATPSLTANVGSLPSAKAAMVRWEMRSRLSGRFTGFLADVWHSDELGGNLTALVRDPETRRLEGEVIVDLPGRDSVVDFLAYDSFATDASPLRVYESRSVNLDDPTSQIDPTVPVANINLSATVSVNGLIGLTGLPQQNAFCYLRGADPQGGTRRISRVVRSDGKVLPAANAWTSRRYVPPGPGVGTTSVTDYRMHVFDHIPAGSGPLTWRVEFTSGDLTNGAPIISPLEDRIVRPGQEISFPVNVTDPDGDLVGIGIAVHPYGSTFTTDNNGNGTFTWTPGQDGIVQTGVFPLTFEASDGKTTTKRTIIITVSDDLGINAWKSKYWSEGDPNSANSADPDGDGLTNLYEYALNLDPTRSSVHQRPALTQLTQNGKHYLTLTAQYRTDDNKLAIQVVGTSNPSQPPNQWAFQSAGTMIEPESTPPGYLRARFTDTVAIEDSTSGRFLRLYVRLLP